jgi:plasmid replication initiation protein
MYNLKDKSSIYKEIKKTVLTFELKGFAINTKDDSNKSHRIYFAWFSSIEYLDGQGKIVLELGKSLKEIMLSAKKACFYQLKYSLNFKSIYSQRIYYYLKSFENSNKNNTGWRTDNLDELRSKLECPVTYNRYADFKRYVLKSAQNEINGNSDIQFEFEEIKKNSKVTALKFIIKPNNLIKKQLVEKKDKQLGSSNHQEQDKNLLHVKAILKNILGYDVSLKAANEIFVCAGKHKKYGSDPLELIKEVAEYSKTQNITKGLIAWIKTTVKIYEKPLIVPSVNSFTNYDQREYDYDALEKKLLGWE